MVGGRNTREVCLVECWVRKIKTKLRQNESGGGWLATLRNSRYSSDSRSAQAQHTQLLHSSQRNLWAAANLGILITSQPSQAIHFLGQRLGLALGLALALGLGRSRYQTKDDKQLNDKRAFTFHCLPWYCV